MASVTVKLVVLILFATACLAGPVDHFRDRYERRTTISTWSMLSRGVVYPEYNISVPIDHFHNDSRYEPHTNDTFNLRYWFDASYYAPGGPVFVIQSGETSGLRRLGFLEKGIIHQLAKEFHGIGVVLEHRYYGSSMPTENLSTENLRFLSTDQALADEAYFAQSVVFEGLEDRDLTAPGTAYIGYGGSYAGGFNAFLRKLYPDVFFGTISSSGVTEAIYDYWQYFEPIRIYGPANCITKLQKFTHIVDNILISKESDASIRQDLKEVFGLGNLTYDADFVQQLVVAALGSWQSRNWDPELNDPTFELYCANLTSSEILYPATLDVKSTVERIIVQGGYEAELRDLTAGMLNYIGWINATVVSTCTESQDECFSNYNMAKYAKDDITQEWRSWPYQYCTEWGYLQTGSGTPDGQLPLISRLLDIEFFSIVCRAAFNITTPPDIGIINKHGGYGISYPRLAIIDGEQDPWRPATPHASPFIADVHNRTNTASEPFLLIEGGVHHWDENGLLWNETTEILPPRPVREVQRLEMDFVKEWMLEWNARKQMLKVQP